jgi:cytochrome c553
MAIFPRLAGQHADYLLRQMQVFQSTDFRPGTPMTAITHALSEAQMRSVAHFLAAGGPPARSTP